MTQWIATVREDVAQEKVVFGFSAIGCQVQGDPVDRFADKDGTMWKSIPFEGPDTLDPASLPDFVREVFPHVCVTLQVGPTPIVKKELEHVR